MTNEQKELLQAMHLIKNHCENHDDCETCCLTKGNSIDDCPFKNVPQYDWKLKPLEEEEKDFSVFK